MNSPLSAAALRRLQMVAEVPDLSHTKYEIVEPIGRGGMGSVFLAKDRDLDRMVALKVVGTFSPDTDVFDRLVREAKILARLDHPGVVPIYDVGRLPDGRPFYTMKLVRGRRLDAHILAQPSRLERLRIFERLCAVVAFAHENHVVHCDLKPENVMVGRFGEVLVMDWGIATVDAAAESSGAVIGTPGYMSPEQTRGEPADERSDVYALGAILTSMLDSPPRPLAAIIDRAMANDPAARYQTVDALAADMNRFDSALPVHAYRETIGERSSRLARKYAGPIALVAAYLLMRMLLLAFAR